MNSEVLSGAITAEFRESLVELESERESSLRDSRGFAFACGILRFLSLVCFASLIYSGAGLLFFFSLIFLLGSFYLSQRQWAAALAYREHFREAVTRPWFRGATGDAYLVRTNSAQESIVGFLQSWRRKPVGSRVHEKIVFDRDGAGSEVFVVSRMSLLGTLNSLCVWRQSRLHDERGGFILFDRSRGWQRLLNSPKLHAYPTRGPKPRVAEIDAAQDLIRKIGDIAGSHRVEIDVTTEFVYLAIDLHVLNGRRVFTAPFEKSCLEESNYSEWFTQLELIRSPEIRSQLALLR